MADGLPRIYWPSIIAKHALLNLSDEAFIAFDDEGIILVANRPMGDLVGCTPQSLLGKDVSELIAESGTVHEQSMADLHEKMHSNDMEPLAKVSMRRRDGELIDVHVCRYHMQEPFPCWIGKVEAI